jgi:hypothetical protein
MVSSSRAAKCCVAWPAAAIPPSHVQPSVGCCVEMPSAVERAIVVAATSHPARCSSIIIVSPITLPFWKAIVAQPPMQHHQPGAASWRMAGGRAALAADTHNRQAEPRQARKYHANTIISNLLLASSERGGGMVVPAAYTWGLPGAGGGGGGAAGSSSSWRETHRQLVVVARHAAACVVALWCVGS